MSNKLQIFLLVFLFFIIYLFALSIDENTKKINEVNEEIELLKENIEKLNKELDELKYENTLLNLSYKQSLSASNIEDNNINEDALEDTLNLSDSELLLLAKIVHAEARGESYEGKLAVASVILNRVDSPNFPNSIEEVIYQKGQFQPVRNGSINKSPCEESIKAAQQALSNRTVEDALFFYNPKIATDKWIRTREIIKIIGNHAFAG